jgi:signal transduction histidine kinase/CheY-like chemotaxis protein
MFKRLGLSIIFALLAGVGYSYYSNFDLITMGKITTIFIIFTMLNTILFVSDYKEVNNQPKESNSDEYALLQTNLNQATNKVSKLEDKLKNTELFLASVSHEIRTPLYGIAGITDVLQDTPLNQEQQEYVSIIKESSNHLKVILNDILDISKINAGKLELEQIEFDLFSKLETSANLFINKMKEKDIILNLYTDPKIPQYVMGDPTRLSQVIINLVSNAVKFTPDGGHIDINATYIKEDSNNITFKISVQDSGVGLTPEQQQRIFEPYTQADASTTRKAGGTGLGLTISSKIVEAMNSKLEVKSEIDEGATFEFTLTLPKALKYSKEYKSFDNLNVGVSISSLNPNSKWQSILESYISYFNANFQNYNELDLRVLPDILIVDYENIINKDVSIFENQNYKKVLVVNSSEDNDFSTYKEVFDKIVYRPITLNKLEEILEIGQAKKQEIQNEEIQSEEIQSEEIQSKEIQSKEIQNEEVKSFENLKILVTEDNPVNQKLIMTILNNFGINATIAQNGEDAVTLRKKHDYDMIFMDIQMPVMDGEEATKHILEYEKQNNLPHIPIVALTANALAGDKEKYMALGIDDYTTKPLDIQTIKKLIIKYCNVKEK